jgi:predicted extracellular nuclease
MKILKFCKLTAILLLVGAGQNFAQTKKSISIAFYNAENLYDTKDDPEVDDAEFLPEAKNNWTEERYQKKLANLSQVIDSLGGGPSVLGMCEVENRGVLEDLIKTTRLQKKGYEVVHENSPDKRGIDVALLYKKSDFQPVFHKMIRVVKADDPEFITRDIMLVKGVIQKQPIYFFVNHWPSRRGGEAQSVGKRMEAAKAARFSIDTILKSNSQARIVLMGDFNDEPIDSSLTTGLGVSLDGKGDLVNLMADLKAKGEGSHHFNNGRHMLDQIVVSKSLLNSKGKIHYKAGSATIYKPVWMQETNPKYLGNPLRTYAGAKYLGGYSDHFPVYCIMEF